MADNPDWPRKAYKNYKFLNSKDARGLRILSEYMEPEARFEEFQVRDTVVFSVPPGSFPATRRKSG